MRALLRLGWFGLALAVGAAGGSAAEAGVSPRDYQRLIEQLSEAHQSDQQLDQQMTAYDVVFRRDPMRPIIDAGGGIVVPAGLHDGLSVQGIIWSDQRPLTVIEGDIYAAGERVGPYKLIDITPHGVVVERGPDLIFIPLDRGLSVARPAPPPTAAPSKPARISVVVGSPVDFGPQPPPTAPSWTSPAPVPDALPVTLPTDLSAAPSLPTLPMKLDARPIPTLDELPPTDKSE
jgi:hypothetical protein